MSLLFALNYKFVYLLIGFKTTNYITNLIKVRGGELNV